MTIIDIVKKEMKNRTLNVIDANDYLQELTIKKYICDELSSNYIQTLFKSHAERRQLEQRDEKMSKHIHRLLKGSKNNRYFFAIGAGILYLFDRIAFVLCFFI